MNSRSAFLLAAVSVSVGGFTWCLTARSSPPAPAPTQSAQPSGNSSNSNSNGGNRGSSRNTSPSGSSSGNRNRDRRGYPYDPYGGRPITGVYTPGMAGSDPPTSGGTPGTTSTPTTNPSAPGLFPDPAATPAPAPTITPPTPAAPPDPEIVAATAALDDAVAQVKKSLKSNSGYMAALAAKQEAKDEATAYREKGDGVPGDIVSIAQKGLEAGKKITAIEREAMAKDPTVVAARARLADAIKAHNAAK